MTDEELREALRQRGYSDEQIDVLLSVNPPAEDPPEDDPPDPEVVVGPRLRSAEDLKRDFEEGVKAKGARFIRRISSPKKDPIKAGAADAAEDKFASKLRVAIEQRRRQKKLGRLTFEDWATEVAKLKAEDWTGPTTRKADKWGKRFKETEPLRLYILSKLDAMPVDTAEARARKMTANLECMRILGEFTKGVITETEARSRVDEVTR